MSWFDSGWSHRQALVIDNLSGAATIDATAALPADFAPFWDNVQATGNDIRVTLADGRTLATFDLDGWNHANKVGTIEIDNLSASSSDAMLVLWVYWGNGTAPAATTSFTPSTPKAGYFVPDCMPAGYLVTAAPTRPGNAKPAQRVQKTVAEEIHVWWDLRGMLSRRNSAYNGSPLCEEIDNIALDVSTGGASQASMFDENETRVLTPGLIRTSIKGGQDNTDYTISLTVVTTEGKTLNPRALLLVRNIDEA